MSKQTAVEWLVEQIDNPHTLYWLNEAIEQAKKMEKEQIENAFQDGKWDWSEHITNGTESKDLTQYYKETYGGNK